jgi:hypothetical protein
MSDHTNLPSPLNLHGTCISSEATRFRIVTNAHLMICHQNMTGAGGSRMPRGTGPHPFARPTTNQQQTPTTMNTDPITPTFPALPPAKIEILTSLPLRTDFVTFATRGNWENIVAMTPIENTDGENRAFECHLGRRDAIKFDIQFNEGEPELRRIILQPGVLFYDDPDYPLTEKDVLSGLSRLIDEVTPMLRDPDRDTCRVVPGVGNNDSSSPQWSSVGASLMLEGVRLANFYDLSYGHPNFVRCADDLDFLIDIEELALETLAGHGSELTTCPAVRVILGIHYVEGDDPQFFESRSVNLAPHFIAEILQIKGYYLPVPKESIGESEILKIGRLIAMTSKEDPDVHQTVTELAQLVFAPTKSRRAKLMDAIQIETSRLNSIPVSALFTPEVFAARAARRTRECEYPIHPLIAAAYDVTAG